MIMIMTVISWVDGLLNPKELRGGSTDIYLIDPHHMLGAESCGIIPGSQARKTGLK